MLCAIVTEIGAAHATENDAIGPEHASLADFAVARPTRRAIGFGAPPLAGAPDRHGDRDDDREEASRCGNAGALEKDGRRIGVEGKPPPRSEEHKSELQSLMSISYAVFCLKKTKKN